MKLRREQIIRGSSLVDRGSAPHPSLRSPLSHWEGEWGRGSLRATPHVSGFTLLELIIVLAIMTILLSIAIPTYQVVIRRARETVLKQNLYQMRRQIEEFAADQGRYPQSLQELVDRGYLKEVPLDPITNSRETWEEIREEGPSLGQDNQPGVVDVKSGAEGESTEGTPYSEW